LQTFIEYNFGGIFVEFETPSLRLGKIHLNQKRGKFVLAH